jgi:hypothetical protein
VRVIEASMWGTTLPDAATAYVRDAVAAAESLARITELVAATLLADLPAATADVMQALQERAAVGTDVQQLLDALPALVRVVRYGNVRDTDVQAVEVVVEGLVVRIAVGLGGAVSSLDDDAADKMSASVSNAHGALALLDRSDLREQWERALGGVAARDNVHGLVVGRAARLLFDGGKLAGDEAARRLSLALSRGGEPAQAAAWIEGFLSGGGLVLVHDDALLGVVDTWLADVDEDAFTSSLPALRRTFATFAPAERRQIGERVRHGARITTVADADDALDHERAALVLPVLAQILGVEH